MKVSPPQASGVYQIRCMSNGKIYIGSAVSLRDRWNQHRQQLRSGSHHNIHLQHAWNKYGEADFEFSVLEFVDPPNLLGIEQTWIDKTRCTDRTIGFNIFATAGSPGSAFAQTWEGFFDPDGHEVTITNLYDFCRQHALDFPSMHRLAMGKSKLKSYKGWTHQNSIRRRDYVKTYDGFINPEGKLIGPVTNLAEFCRQQGLDNTHMVALARGRICSHRGWTHTNGRQKQVKMYTGFLDPAGQRVTITNLVAFCRQHGLSSVRMHALISGKRKSHKGWTWSEDDA